jgi:hypothetical protein
MTKEELEAKSDIANLAKKVGIGVLSDEDAKSLLLWETWKDGASWGTVLDMSDDLYLDDETVRCQLVDIYGYHN